MESLEVFGVLSFLGLSRKRCSIIGLCVFVCLLVLGLSREICSHWLCDLHVWDHLEKRPLDYLSIFVLFCLGLPRGKGSFLGGHGFFFQGVASPCLKGVAKGPSCSLVLWSPVRWSCVSSDLDHKACAKRRFCGWFSAKENLFCLSPSGLDYKACAKRRFCGCLSAEENLFWLSPSDLDYKACAKRRFCGCLSTEEKLRCLSPSDLDHKACAKRRCCGWLSAEEFFICLQANGVLREDQAPQIGIHQ